VTVLAIEFTSASIVFYCVLTVNNLAFHVPNRSCRHRRSGYHPATRLA
jgi:hypothetical protein